MMAQQCSTIKAAPAVSRAHTVAAAHSNSRRQVVGGLALGLAALLPSSSRAAKYPPALDIEIFDDRKAKKANDKMIDAMDQELSFQERDGLVQAISQKAETKARITAQQKYLQTTVKAKFESGTWWEATGALRGELGFLRYDISAIAENLPRDKKRSLLQLKKKLFEELEEFDIACGQGIRPDLADKALATKIFAKVEKSLADVVSAVAVA